MSSIVHIQQLSQLLQAEKNAERKQYDAMMRQTSVPERIKLGACWFPLNQISHGWGLGNHPFVVVERTKHLDTPHRFRAGQIVSIFAEQFVGNAEPMSEKGIVHYVDKHRIKIILYGTELPGWVLSNRIGIQLEFDERSYQEMEVALKTVEAAPKGSRLAELREILLGYREPSFRRDVPEYDLDRLNPSQRQAVQQIMSAYDFAAVHGPPGTGKTTTLVEAIRHLAKRESPILVCAASNAATDLLTERLAAKGLYVIRIGNISRVDESLVQHTVEGILERRPEMQEVKKMKIQAQQLYREADRYHRTFGPEQREERRSKRQEAKDLLAQAKMLEDYVMERILSEADVICSTLVSSTHGHIAKREFKTVIIDEAAQALEPATWIPILRAERVILAGDPFQLPPTVKDLQTAKQGLSVTLLERVVANKLGVSLLRTQYRMNKQIMAYSNQVFYQGQLEASEYVADWTLDLADGRDTKPLEWIDTAGCGFEEKINPETQSFYNPEEYGILRMHLDHLLCLLGEQRPSIAIISPYKEQVIYMQDNLPKDFDHFPQADIRVDTIDSFQGQECDVVYISLVRSNDKSEIGFLRDTRRMNVAMTRARKKLIMLGDSATLGAHEFYSQLLAYCESIDAYGTAWEWM